MTGQDLLKAGRLREAIDAVTAQVKARPADTALRVFLFELLCFDGALARAGKQLDVIGTQSEGVAAELAVQVYRNLLAAEQVRRDVFHGDALPKFLLTPPAHVEQYILLVKALSRTPKEAVAMLPAAEEACAPLGGQAGERRFSNLRDADDRVAPVLEAFHGADYLWLPLEQVRRLQFGEPKSLRDLLWAHAHVETIDGSAGDVFVPTLYVDTSEDSDDRVRLGRTTTWRAVEEQLVVGSGQRLFLADDVEIPLLELREVLFEAPVGRAVSV
jgi:type VI secretion system protein ImpE